MRCSNCGAENPEGLKFCNQCAAPFKSKCAKCGFENPPTAKFCGECAAPLTRPAGRPDDSRAPADTVRIRAQDDSQTILEGERKTVTALFADIKGSTELMAELDPEEARSIIDPALKLMIDAVRRYDGYVVQSTGDGIFALFGAPLAHEDHPQRALYAALRMQDELRRYSARLVAEGGMPIQCRVGVNTGEVVVRSIATGAGHTEYTPIGHTTNLASRMQAVAPVGSIAASDTTRHWCEGYFTFKPLGPTRLRGVHDPIEVHEVTGLGPLRSRLQRAAGRGLTRLVGRERDMEALKHAAEQARAGHGQIVAAMAEPGVGKSRLLYEFKASSQSGWMVLEAFSVSHGKAARLLPVIDLLWNYFCITSEDDERTRREKITGRVLALDRTLGDALPYLSALLGLNDANSQLAEIEPQTRSRRSLEAIKRILLRESLAQPLIVIFEDLHWMDSESQIFLNMLADSIGTARILMLVNYRPEYRQEWSNKTYYTQLRLDPLGRESAGEMLTTLLGESPEVTPLKHLIIEKTEGNPFFMEEMVLGLLDDGTLVRNGQVKLTRPLSQLGIPPTVEAILAARIDLLGPGQKDLLQSLAIIGKEFRLGLVAKVVGRSIDELERMLTELQLGEFIYEQPSLGDVEYTFKHALTQEVAANSVLAERRRMLHEQTAAAYESLYADSLDDHIADLAYHYARSGNPRKAVEYCLRACSQCSDRGSFDEAVTYFKTGIVLLQKLPDDDRRAELELDLRMAAGMPLITITGYGSPEGQQLYERAMILCQRPGLAWEKTWLALFGVHNDYLVRADLRKASETAAELLRRARVHSSAEHLVMALKQVAFARMLAGDFALAAQGFDQAIDILALLPRVTSGPPQRRIGLIASEESPAYIWIISGWNLWFLGYPDQAVERLNTASALARESGSREILEMLYNFAVFIHLLRGEVEHLRETAEATFGLATELGNSFRRAVSEIFLGWTQAMEGEPEAGITRMRRGLADMRAPGAESTSEYYLALMATVLCRMRQSDESLRMINESISIIERTGERYYEAMIYQTKGDLLLMHDPARAAQAEECFRMAIAIARKQQAKSWELRATASLARLLARQGLRDEARTTLAEIYGWFTEGFDTADLKDAKALLDELAG